MSVDSKTVDRIAELSRLEFKPEEKTEIQADLNKMLDFVAQIEEVDTAGVAPLIYILEEETSLRKDEALADYGQKDALRNAPDKDSDFIRLPKVLDNK
ncbi:MAG: Asp-tRNA(Asn)/Glu-tRNA(Gln) amidotransferase subunit GatC [Vicingaceae bacterium]